MRRIAYLTWPAREISGGVKAVFQHVELLAAAGFEAVVASPDGLRPHWFASAAPVIPLEQVGPGDVLVFPENDNAGLERFAASRQPKVVFCQNPVQVWRGVGTARSYADHGVSHVLAASHTILRYCALRFPALPRRLTPYFIDHDRFRCPAQKKLQVTCIPRKRPLESMAVRDLLHAVHPDCADVPWVLIRDAAEPEVAQAMADAAVFLSLARLEGHSLTTLEAMASGCVVAGFVGNVGGNDTATVANGLWVPEDDVVACADALGRAIRIVREQGDAFQSMVLQARRTAAQYRREEVQPVVAQAWRELLAEFG